MLIKKAGDIPSSEITPKSLYLNRRNFLAGAALAGAAAATGIRFRGLMAPQLTAFAGNKIDGIKKSGYSTTETITAYKDVTNYNNYYEFSTDKYQPASLAKNFRTRPWKVTGQYNRAADLPEILEYACAEGSQTLRNIFGDPPNQ